MYKKKFNKRTVGTKYENMAVEYLKKCDYEILETNYRNSYGEIDIIAKDNDVIVFTEVKFRVNNFHGDPIEAVDIRKQRRITRVALYYYVENGYTESMPCRFDVIAIYGDRTIRHEKNAFCMNL